MCVYLKIFFLFSSFFFVWILEGDRIIPLYTSFNFLNHSSHLFNEMNDLEKFGKYDCWNNYGG